MVSSGYNKRINGSWLESTNTRRCFCCWVILVGLPLLVLSAEVFGQKENTQPELRMQPPTIKLNPAPPTAIRIGPKTELPGGPAARIAPESLKVKQGEPAVFRNVSLFDPDVPLERLSWIGPDKVRKQTDPFEVQTGNLQPGNYQIILEVFDKRNRSSNAKATLEVLALPPKRAEKAQLKDPRIIPPEVPGRGNESTPPQERPVAKIQPDRLRAVPGERVVFRSVSTPAGRVQERWIGPGAQRGTGRNFVVDTSQLTPGSYQIMLDILGQDKQQDRATAELVVALQQEKPVARIQPGRLQAMKGAKTVFESVSTPAGRVRERWKGPADQQGTGRRFEVDTSQLTPGSYEIVLEIADRYGQRDRATATLEVLGTPTREKPVGKIRPERLRVAPGEKVVFESDSTPAGGVRERWEGPADQQGTGRRFEVDTSRLTPGTYEIALEIADRHGQRDRATAALEVIGPPPRVRLSAKPNPARKGEKVSFRAIEEPPREDLEYLFIFGDGQTREWSRDPAAEHYYASPGNFEARVSVRMQGKEPWPGDIVAILVEPATGQQSNGGNGPFAVLVAFVAGGGYLLFQRIRKNYLHRPSRVRFNPAPDPGKQDFENAGLSGIESEMKIRSVTDRGEQDIEIVGSLISEERREHE